MAQRERRANAGNRMAKLLDEEEEDDFYKTTYGGFQDVEEDRDYVKRKVVDVLDNLDHKANRPLIDDSEIIVPTAENYDIAWYHEQEKEQDDVIDSDFDIDENDDPVSDQEAEGKEKKKSSSVYKDPNRKKKAFKKAAVKKTKEPKTKEEKGEKPEKSDKTIIDTSIERKSIRQTTALKSAETQERIKIRSELKKKKPKKVEDKMPTQEELLEEALITEQENLKSLEKFEQIEMERKKVRPTKKTITGPVIRYHSFAVPVDVDTPDEENQSLAPLDLSLSGIMKSEDVLLTPGEVPVATDLSMTEPKTETEETNDDTDGDTRMDIDVIGPDEEIDVDKVTTKDEKPKEEKPNRNVKYHERTLLSFVNDIKDKAFNSCFPKSQPKRRRELLCAVTKRPARYIDPITKLPYRSVDAFRIIREAYYQQLEARGDRNDPQVAAWLQWRRADAASTYVQIHIK